MSLANILSLLRALPELIGLLKSIWGALQDAYEAYDRRRRVKELKDAIQKAKETKDTSELEKYFGAGAHAKSADNGG